MSVHAICFRNFIPDEPVGKVLYRDEVVIRQVYDCITAMATLDSTLAQRLLFRAAHDVYQQIARLECKPREDTNFDYLVLLLSSIVLFKESVSDLVRRVYKEKEDKPKEDFVYPGMPLRICGVVHDEDDVHESKILLHVDEFDVQVLLDQEHSLHQDIEFLKDRFLFVLGVVDGIENEVMIKAGALLL